MIMDENSVVLEDGQSKTVLMSSAPKSRTIQTVFFSPKPNESTIIEFD